ncbi:HTH domain-containing protein [Microbispora amethystogenes]|uniref:HTH domain-containing protein n=1 Tax=Microbispora amethystogenes TaxID=1427754 RepID=UPI0033CA2EBC
MVTTERQKGQHGKTLDRLQLFQQLRKEGITKRAELADKLGVHPRTVYRYVRMVDGPANRRNLYEVLGPRILAHLRNFPDARLSYLDVQKVLGEPDSSGSSLQDLLRRMARDGLLRAVREPRDESTPHQIVTRYQIPEGQVTGE